MTMLQPLGGSDLVLLLERKQWWMTKVILRYIIDGQGLDCSIPLSQHISNMWFVHNNPYDHWYHTSSEWSLIGMTHLSKQCQQSGHFRIITHYHYHDHHSHRHVSPTWRSWPMRSLRYFGTKNILVQETINPKQCCLSHEENCLFKINDRINTIL